MTTVYLSEYNQYDGPSRSAELSEDSKYRYWLRRSWKYGGRPGETQRLVMTTTTIYADCPLHGHLVEQYP